ncbi:MAG: hypothetical protein ILA02_03145 [Clostridia bacterium]|nr:hypothetical protein [Clostridia bacterium]
MKYIKKLILFLQNLFHKDEIKAIDAPLPQPNYSQKDSFVNSLKNTKTNKKAKEVETLICEGDGLGIQKKITY